MIWKYQKRRLVLKEQHGNFSGKTKRITKKISSWNLQIRRIDKRNKFLNELIDSVNEYFDVDIRSSRMDGKHKLARKVYYKYAMEKRIQGTFVSKMINRKNIHTASEGRLRFTRSFKSNPENKKIYHNFVNYIK